MSVIVESLEVEIKQKGDKASSSIDRLTYALRNMRLAVAESIAPLKEFNDELQSLGKFSSYARKELSGLGKNAERNAAKITGAFERAREAMRDFQAPMSMNNNFTFGGNDFDFSGLVDKYNQMMNSRMIGGPTINPSDIIDFVEIDVDDYRMVEEAVQGITLEMAKSADYAQILKWELEAVELELNKATSQNPQDIGKIARLSKQYQRLKAEIAKCGEETKKLGKESSKTHSKFSKLLSTIGRIAMYRAIRSLIKGITSAISEGVTNAYQFSKAMGGEFASTMDTLASINLQMKNQFGSAFSELIIAVEPYLTMLIQKAIQVADTISQIFAYLNGDTMYKKAKYVAKAWKDAAGSAKDLKDQLLGIDELNILRDDKTLSGSASAIDPSTMFEYAPISNSAWTRTIDWIRDNFDMIKAIARDIGIILLGWKLSSTLANLLRGLVNPKITTGITMMITGAVIEFAGAYDIGKNGANWRNVLETIVGAAGVIGGGLLAFGATSLVFTIPLAIAIAGVAIHLGHQAKLKQEFESSELGQRNLRINATFDEIEATNVELKARVNAISTSIDAKAMADLELAKRLIDEIFEIDAKDNKTALEIDRIKSKIDIVNGLNIDGLYLSFNDTKGMVEQTKNEVTKLIDEIERQYQLEAIKQAYIDSYRAEFDARTNVTKATKAQKDKSDELMSAQIRLTSATQKESVAYNELAEFNKKYYTVGTRNVVLTGEAREKQLALKDALELARQEVESSQYAVDTLTEEYEAQNQIVADAKDIWNEAKDVYNIVQTEMEKVVNQSSSVKSATEEVANAAREVGNSWAHAVDELERYNNTTVADHNAISINGTAQRSVSMYASGGYPESGQLFIANEGGSPEMVGRWGNNTAVANTGQIVEGIQAGVASAVSSTLAPYLAQIASNTLKTANKSTTIAIGDREIARANNSGQRKLGRQLITQ